MIMNRNPALTLMLLLMLLAGSAASRASVIYDPSFDPKTAKFAVWLEGSTTSGGNGVYTSLTNVFGVASVTLVTTAELETPGFLSSFTTLVVSRYGDGFGSSLSAKAASNVVAYVGTGATQGGVVIFANDVADNLKGSDYSDPLDPFLDQLYINAAVFDSKSGHGYLGEFNGAVMAMSTNTAGYVALGLLPGAASGTHMATTPDGQFHYDAGPIGPGNPIDAGVSFPFTDADKSIFRTDITGASAANIVDTFDDNGLPAILANSAAIFGGLHLSITPALATNVVGMTHTVTIAVTGATGSPVGGVVISNVVTGANTARGSCISDTTGTCMFSYVGSAVGTDTIAVAASLGGLSATGAVTKVWIAATPCTLSCPADLVTTNDLDHCTAGVAYPAPVASSTCSSVTCTPASGAVFPVGTTTVTCTTTNGTTCSFKVTVMDTQKPTVACPASMTTTAAVGATSATVTYATPVASDNCPGASVVCVPASGASFPLGDTVVTCTATDAAGNTGTCSFTVTVSAGTTPPTIACPTDISTNTAPGICTRTLAFAPTATGSPTPVIVCKIGSSAVTSPYAFPTGATTVTCTATNSAGTASCSFTVTVVDAEKPTVICPASITTAAAAGATSATVTYGTPAASDNCPGASVVCVPASGASFPLGDTVITCTATDAAGNTGTCSFTVTVSSGGTPMTPPTITCPSDVSTNTAPGTCTRTLTFAPTATGSPTPVIVCKIGSSVVASPHAFPSGTTTVTCTATNSPGMASCSFKVSVVDDAAPVLTGCADVLAVAPTGSAGTTVILAVSASDNCDGAVPVTCAPAGPYFALGDTPVTCVAVDHVGNSASCAFTVTVTEKTDAAHWCSLTQGFYGNANGRFNGSTSLSLVGTLLAGGPMVLGIAGSKSVLISSSDAAALEALLPAGGPPAPLSFSGDKTLATASLPLNKKGRISNILIGQTITLALNARLSPALLAFGLTSPFCTEAVLPGPDGLIGTAHDIPVTTDVQSFTVPASVLAALADPAFGILDSTVKGVLALGNRALAGLPTSAASLGDITAAEDAINRGFDECRELTSCSTSTVVPDSAGDTFSKRPTLGGPGSGAALLRTNSPQSPPPAPLNIRAEGSNLRATKEAGEPDVAANPGGHSVWWQWQAPRTGLVKIETLGSSFDTLLGVFTGSVISNLVLVASNDDVPGGLSSAVTFEAQAGTDYQIVVDGVDGAVGAIVLTLIAAPPTLCLPESIAGTPPQVRLCVDGELGRTYTVEASPDLIHWTLLGTATNTDGTLRFVDPARSNVPDRFYRLTFAP
jgi:hypothetical protein